MRVTRQQAAENRDRILTAAARLFRERGVAGVGVDAVTDAAGLTHGSLYSQFGSKEALAAEALEFVFAGSAERYRDVDTLADYAARYLSERHLGRIGDGCAVAALAGDMPRATPSLRAKFTAGIKGMIARLARLRGVEDAALADAATLVGALMLARAVDDAELSSRILAAARQRISAG